MILQKLKKHSDKGFTLIELMIVIAIIGILAAIAIPNFIQYRKRGYNAAANADIKNAFTAAQVYFGDSPAGIFTSADLALYGFVSSADTTTTVNSGTTNIDLTSSHASGDRTYYIDLNGEISFD